MESKIGSIVGQIDGLSLNDMNREPIVVTHVENPEKFYCRLASDEHKLKELNELIWSGVRSPFNQSLDYHLFKSGDHLLAYSSINKCWCRSELLKVIKTNDTIINAKVLLIDFGSIEIIAWNQLKETTEEIINFNSCQSLCFECSLCYIKPFNDSNEWSSYANYLFENLTKDKKMTLNYHNFCDGVIYCDLSSYCLNSDLNESIESLIDYLVHTRVARYKMGQHFYHRLYAEDGIEVINRDDSNQDIHRFDDELNIQYNPNNKLFY